MGSAESPPPAHPQHKEDDDDEEGEVNHVPAILRLSQGIQALHGAGKQAIRPVKLGPLVRWRWRARSASGACAWSLRRTHHPIQHRIVVSHMVANLYGHLLERGYLLGVVNTCPLSDWCTFGDASIGASPCRAAGSRARRFPSP